MHLLSSQINHKGPSLGESGADMETRLYVFISTGEAAGRACFTGGRSLKGSSYKISETYSSI